MIALAPGVLSDGERGAESLASAPVAVKRLVQALLAGPVVLMQDAMISASVLISAMGALTPAGSDGPPAVPCEVSASNAALANALTRPVGFEPDAPMWAMSAANGAEGIGGGDDGDLVHKDKSGGGERRARAGEMQPPG